MLTSTDVSVIGCSIMALAMHTTYFFSSVSAANRLPLVLFTFPVTGWLPTDVSCTISNGTGYKLYGTISPLVEKILFTNLPMKDVPRRTETTKFLTLPDSNRTRASLKHTWSTIVQRTSVLSFVALRNRGFSLTWIDLIQSGSTMLSRTSSDPAPV